MRMLNQWMKLAPVLAITVAASACSDTSPTEIQGLQANAPSAALIGSTGVAQVIVYPGTFTLDAGQVKQMIALPKNAKGTTLSVVDHPLTWRSSNPNVATVDAKGRVVAVGGGKTEIRATYDGVSGSSPIVVRAPIKVASITIHAPDTKVEVGTFTQLRATPRDASGDPVSVPLTWVSSNPGVLEVYSNGLVKAHKAGKATISAKADGSVARVVISAAALVSAPAPAPAPDKEAEAPRPGSDVASVVVFPYTTTLGTGLVKQFIALPRSSSGTTLSGKTPVWHISDTSVATISSTGTVITRSPGTVKITATVDGTVGTATLTVTR